MNPMIPLLILGALGAVSCSDDTPVAKRKTSSKSSASSGNEFASILSDPARFKAYVASLAGNPAALAQMEARDKAEAAELATLKDVNQKLCARVQQLRNGCAATYRLIPVAGDKELACASGNGDQNVMSAKWEVQLGASRKYRILVDNNWESSEFGQGTTTITWKARTPSSTTSPRLIDLTQVQILPVDGGSVSDLGGFSLVANGVSVFSAGDVVRANESNGYYMVSMQKVLDLRSSAACKLTQADLDAIVKGG